MSTHPVSGVLNTFSIGGSSQLEFFENASISFEEVQVEGAPISRVGGNAQGTKMRGRIEASLWSDSSTAIRVSHLGLSLAALGAVNLLSPNVVRTIRFGCQHQVSPNPGAGQLWEVNGVDDAMLSAQLILGVDSADQDALLMAMLSSTYADRNKTLDFTIGGVQIQAPFRQKAYTLPLEKGGKQIYTLDLADRSARSGVTVLPSGTTSLLEKSLNAFRTALAFVFQGSAHPAVNISGNMVFNSMDLEITDAGLVPIRYTFMTTGDVAGVETT